ncbi:DUF1850 domain-containing protein [Bacillus marasmi]|uniref:DUF1850 domain-containing protein n=1 Tax=Bacillus marasmi TaxID=1926279 RepID=UPI0011CBC606|nr:DUF1850 domain-containing protein [Bacillus marasmi]
MKAKILLGLLTMLGILLAVLFIPYQQALVFEFENSDKQLAFVPIKQDVKFKIKYTHSIHLSDVQESFRLTNEGVIQLYELEYEDFAVGMPSNAEDGEMFIESDGKYFIKNMNRLFHYIDLRIGQVRANHTVIYRENQYPLTKFIKPGTWVRLKSKHLNLIQQMKGVNILE